MSEYFSFEKSRLLHYLFKGDISRSEIEISELLNGIQRRTKSKYDYMQQPSTEERDGETLAIYPLWTYFLQRGSLIVRARTKRNIETNFSGGEEKVTNIDVRHTRGMSKPLYFQLQKYLINLEKGGKKNE